MFFSQVYYYMLPFAQIHPERPLYSSLDSMYVSLS